MKKQLLISCLFFANTIFSDDHPMLTIVNETGHPLTIRNGNKADFYSFEVDEASRFPTRGEPVNVSINDHNAYIQDITIPYNLNNVTVSYNKNQKKLVFHCENNE